VQIVPAEQSELVVHAGYGVLFVPFGAALLFSRVHPVPAATSKLAANAATRAFCVNIVLLPLVGRIEPTQYKPCAAAGLFTLERFPVENAQARVRLRSHPVNGASQNAVNGATLERMWKRLVLAALLAGCTGANGPSPATAARALLTAGDNPHAAYHLLSKGVRRTISEDQFVNRWRASLEERKAQTAALSALLSQPTGEHARASWPDARQAELVHEPAGWRLASPRIGNGGAASPEDAIRRFADALEHHDMDGLLELLADPLRGQLEREIADRLSRLKSSLSKDIRVEGNHARIRIDDRYYLDLRLEDGRWRVSDFN
jgi:hypothetical protein